jgi:uncharacterized membrane protein YhiD involved in acid resistance
MFEDLNTLFTFDLSFVEVVGRLVVGLVCGLIISTFYRWSHRGNGYSSTFVIALIALCMITSTVIMVIGNNLARAFGLVGAMSIIRFRSAVKETADIVFIFFSLAMGMAVGVGLHVVALTSSVFIGLTIWILTLANYGRVSKREYLLQISYAPTGEQMPAYNKILDRFCRRYRLVNVKSVGEAGEMLEASYYVYLKDSEESGMFVQAITGTQGVVYANLFYDEAIV